jgi:mRNA-degrading endonuclease YafQ of YafQ-DinJ toxin-antitoxin module
VFVFLRQGNQIRKLYHEGELKLLKTMVLLVENIRQDEAAAVQHSLIGSTKPILECCIEQQSRKCGSAMETA